MSSARPLTQQARWLALLFHSAPIAIWITQAGDILWANPAAASLVGLPAAELTAMNVADLLKPPQGDPEYIERSDGKQVAITSRSWPLGEELTGWLIDPRGPGPRSGEAEALQRLLLAEQAAKFGLWDWDVRTGLVVRSPGHRALFRQQPQEHPESYEDWLAHVHPEDRQRIDRETRQALRVGHMDSRFRIIRTDGAVRWLQAVGRAYFDAHRQPVRLVRIVRDVTEEVEREAARKQLEDERQLLLEREHKTRQTAELLNNVGEALSAELDPERLAQKITHLATQLIGAQFGALFRKTGESAESNFTLYTLSGAPRSAFEQFPSPRASAVFAPTFLQKQAVRCSDITVDPRFRKTAPHFGFPPGHLPVRSYLAVPIVSRQGPVLGALLFGHVEPGQFNEHHEKLAVGIASQAAVAMDNARLFEEARLAQQSLRQLNEELRQANQDREQFAFSASHDLKEPLRTIALSVELLEQRYGDRLDEEARRLIQYAKAGARRMLRLIGDLLAYTQAASLRAEMQTRVQLRDIVGQVLEDLAPRIRETQAIVHIGALPAVWGSQPQLAQIFQNLIDNALKYRRPEVQPQIEIGAERQTAEWRIFVKDNGLGIPARHHRQIFGLFKRLHHQDSYGGTGIGLALCQKIVERHGGRMGVESQPAWGSVFWFTLPVGEPQLV